MEVRATAIIAVGVILAGVVALRVVSRTDTPKAGIDAGAAIMPISPASSSAAKPGAQASAFYGGHNPPYKALSELGRILFADASLSTNGDRSCQTCHAPDFAYGPPPGAPIVRRAIPSLRYLQQVPPFSLHHMEEDGSDSGPTGGFMWDGRARTAHEQARLPLLSDAEMGNRTDEALAARVRASTSAEEIKKVFGENAFATDTSTIRTVQLSLETFEQSPADFAPYNSKYDEVLRHRATLTEREERGRELFEKKDKGNCMSCHLSHTSETGFPAFSDWGVIALGVPSKKGAPPDRGACERDDLKDHPELCNAFRTPSLRNTAKREHFFHNGVVTSLTDAVRFYVTRDVTPARWEPSDRTNANMDPPFGKKQAALNEAEIADVVAFLGTLTDGWKE